MIGRIVLLVACLGLPPSTLADCNDDADRARQENRVDEAIEILNDCLAGQLNRLARTYLLLGLSHHEKGNYEEAIAHYTRAIETIPGYAVAWTNRGLSHALADHFESAIADFDRAIGLAPAYYKAYYFRGFTHHLNDHYGKAIADYSRALAHAQDREVAAFIHYRRGMAHKRAGADDTALAEYNSAVERNPSLAEAWFSRGLLHQESKDYEAAIDDYSHVIELQPDNERALYNRGLLYDRTDEDHLAIKDYNKALEVKPFYARARANLAIVRLIPLLPLLLVVALG